MRRQEEAVIGGRRPEILIIRNGRHPMVLLVMAACLASGIMGSVLPPDPSVSIVDRYVPEPWNTTYYITLILSSITVLVGVWLPDLRDRMMVEQIGLWFLSGPLLIYPIVILGVLLASTRTGEHDLPVVRYRRVGAGRGDSARDAQLESRRQNRIVNRSRNPDFLHREWARTPISAQT